MKQIRESKFSKIVAYYLIIMMVLQITTPMQMYALTSGPTQPEFTAFTPIGTSDMVNLTSGDFNYNIPVMDVGGYPLNIAYNSGITMDQEASWVGLGWNLNVGEISRQVRGLPDDFRGDKMVYENRMRDNVTVGTNVNLSPAIFGTNFPFSLGLGVQYNNYEGISFKPSVGASFSISENVGVGFNLSGSVTEGATLSPSISMSGKVSEKGKLSGSLGGSVGASFNSRQGLQNISISAISIASEKVARTVSEGGDTKKQLENISVGGSISLNNTHNYTPTKRIAYVNNNKTFGATIGGEVFGIEGEVRVSGYGSYQSIHPDYKNREVGAYGYDNTQYKNGNEGVLDFNREKEQSTINKNTTSLPVTNYTYDTYNIEGQGVSGMFRPFRSQVGYLYNDDVTDYSESGSFGVEIGLGNLVHGGIDFKVSPSKSRTGVWESNNYALPYYKESNTDKNDPLYEQSAFKHVGELNVDDEIGIFNGVFNQTNALRHTINGGELGRYLMPNYTIKTAIGQYSSTPISTIKRNGRFLRNQSIQKITHKEAEFDKFITRNGNAQPHHYAGMKILQTDGTTYVFGKANYNKEKVEATFDVSKCTADYATGLVQYNGSLTENHSAYSDKYVNRIKTPPYAHSYSITSVLSSDYQDVDNNGPSDSDLGSYTKFDYINVDKYKWRVPYGLNQATFNEGLKTSEKDEKGNYIYGEKELSYLRKIETKTHVAFIDLIDREDAMSVNGENGGRGNIALKCIKSIRLYSKAELERDGLGNIIDPTISSTIKPIKTAHFVYDYSLCKNIPSSSTFGTTNQGKLTLKKLYFTYRDSNMGQYTPYVFDYDEGNPISNPNYNIKGADIWGNYNTNGTYLNTSDFPYVNQDRTDANLKTGAWTLKSIQLPSGGVMKIQTESDDYKHVQNKKAMQMFKVEGAGGNPNPTNTSDLTNQLYGAWGNHHRYLYVKLKDVPTAPEDLPKANSSFNDNYLSEQIGKPIYFKFLLNMNTHFDYVSGYFEIEGQSTVFNLDGKTYASIRLKFLKKEGGLTGGSDVNPIAKSGWGFGRTFLNRAVYSPNGSEVNDDFVSIVSDLVGSIGAMAEIFSGPNAKLEEKGCARIFDRNRSWIRLENPDGHKLGGGLRVKKIELSDSWDVMNSIAPNTAYQKIYNESYGQEYNYDLTDGSSSGVATFEPNASPENPFVEPFYGKDGNYADRIGSPKELNYVEKPFGESFFPSPRVTYSRVSVSNINKNTENGTKKIKKHATGKVVTESYTSYDFPTIVEFTDLDLRPDLTKNPVFEFLDIYSTNHITGSQGFSIETNDMNGKTKSTMVYPEGDNNPISKVEYKYNVGAKNRLDNNFKTVDSKGTISTSLMGVDYDMINDFNESYSLSESYGVNTNLASFLVAIFPLFVPIPLPTYARHENLMRTATNTKVVHKTGVLVETIATDLGSRVSTKNLAWDAKSGQVLATETINEFDDKYYTFNYPAYWAYENMGMASGNINLSGKLTGTSSFGIQGLTLSTSNPTISKYFKIADELIMGDGTRLWVSGYNGTTSIQLMDKTGNVLTSPPDNLNFRVIRSGYKNQQMASMASVTSMINPVAGSQLNDATFLYTTGSTGDADKKVINASAVEYTDIWNSQCENALPNEAGLLDGLPGQIVNPYLYNIKGNWRPVKSHAYLAGRNNFVTPNRRKSGYFVHFSPFYRVNNTTGVWTKNNANWTFASEVTKFSPYGVELENKDALMRYSAAQYGYKYTLPVAVSSNSKYSEMGYDGFEDYFNTDSSSALKPHFGFSQYLENNAENYIITDQKSHTGRNSIAVKPGKKASFVRKINGCKN